jgi:hypothetical protein
VATIGFSPAMSVSSRRMSVPPSRGVLSPSGAVPVVVAVSVTFRSGVQHTTSRRTAKNVSGRRTRRL